MEMCWSAERQSASREMGSNKSLWALLVIEMIVFIINEYKNKWELQM
jgi:hypothetical protein